jgi:hypothetical protein
MSAQRQVTIGGETRTVSKFGSFKGILAGALVGEVADEWNALLAAISEWRGVYREQNKIPITRQQCAERAATFRAEADALRGRSEADLPDGWTARDASDRALVLDARATSWEQTAADMGDRTYIELPTDPSETEIAMYGLPIALRTMMKQVVALLGLALIPERELKGAWRSDDVHQRLEDYGAGLLEDMELGEEVELAVAVWEVIQDQLRPRKQALAKLRGLYSRQDQASETKTEDQPTSTDESQSELPTSSTPSPTPTDGTPSESSSDSTTAPTSPSPVASAVSAS